MKILPCLLAAFLAGRAFGQDPGPAKTWVGWPPPPVRRAPQAPTLLAHVTTKGEVNLTWHEATTVDGYTVLKSSDGNTFKPIGEVKNGLITNYVDPDSAGGKTSFYRVVAHNTDGSMESNTARVRLSVPLGERPTSITGAGPVRIVPAPKGSTKRSSLR